MEQRYTEEDAPSPYEFYFLLLKWRKGAITFDTVIEEGGKWARSYMAAHTKEEEQQNAVQAPDEGAA